MSKHTTFCVGGPADYFTLPENVEEMKAVLRICKETNTPYYILGNGSNLLVGDQGFRGVVLQVYDHYNKIETVGDCIHAQAGALLSKIAKHALASSLEGFEFASGIPGTLGGAVMMNAGAYGGEMKHVIESVRVLTAEGEVKTYSCEEMQFGYRTSRISAGGYVVLDAVIRLKEGNPEEIKAKIDDLTERRSSKQPLEFPSAGSTFKRPAGHFAGQLIEQAGLRGFQMGDAQVSEKHCGFVINRGNATAAEVVALMNEVIRRVEENSGVHLEPEVKRIGEF
jgi:UDP-N-acetylmuramate dehydrogenase